MSLTYIRPVYKRSTRNYPSPALVLEFVEFGDGFQGGEGINVKQ